MSVALRKPMTREQFFAWAEAQEERYEFDGGQPIAMTGGTNAHGAIVRNIVVAMHTRLRGTPCQVLPAEAGGVATIGENTRYPDATVTCSPTERAGQLIPNPVVIFVVVSDNNARTDRVDKMREYRAVRSVRRYVLVAQASPVLVSYSHDDNDGAWTAISLSIGDALAMPEIGIEIPVADIFDGVTFGDDEHPTSTRP